MASRNFSARKDSPRGVTGLTGWEAARGAVPVHTRLLSPLLPGGAAIVLAVSGCTQVEFEAPELDASEASACEMIPEDKMADFGLKPSSSDGPDGDDDTAARWTCSWTVQDNDVEIAPDGLLGVIVTLNPEQGVDELRRLARSEDADIGHLHGYPTVRSDETLHVALSSSSGLLTIIAFAQANDSLRMSVAHEAVLSHAVTVLPELE